MMKRWLVLVLAFALAFSMVAVACAETNAVRYCADCEKYTQQREVKQDLNTGGSYPEYHTCTITPGCIVTIRAYRYTWQCLECGEDTYNDRTVESVSHSDARCPG